MDFHFEHLLQTRRNIIAILNSGADLYTIPPGFKNNLFWNAAHNLVTQQLLCYGLSGLKMDLSSDIIDTYRKGTEASTSQDQILAKSFLISELEDSVERLQNDYKSGLFSGEFKEYPTSYGITLHSIEEAIAFNNIHESLHFGYMMAMRKKL